MEPYSEEICGWCLGPWPCSKSPDCFARTEPRESEFWKDLRENLEDPEFREAYEKECVEMEQIDSEKNAEIEAEGTEVPEDRYESIELILKSRTDGESWFDVIFDMITSDCQGTPYDEETDEDGDPCTCGLEMMGGSGGTLQQCYDHSTAVGYKLQPIDLAKVIIALNEGDYTPDMFRVLDWATKEIESEAYYENKGWELVECPDCGETSRITEVGTECYNCYHVFSEEEI